MCGPTYRPRRNRVRSRRTRHRSPAESQPPAWTYVVFAGFLVVIGTLLLIAAITGARPPIMGAVGVCFYPVAAWMLWVASGSWWVPAIVLRHRVLFGVLAWLLVAAAGVVFFGAGLAVRDSDSIRALVGGVLLVLASIWGVWERLSDRSTPAPPSQPGSHAADE